jgi:hypothetical protein
MKRKLSLVLLLCVLLAAIPSTGAASSQLLPTLSHSFYPQRDIVFVDFHNPYFSPVDTIIVNMTVRDGARQNRIIAIGQARLPVNMVLMPGESTSARVTIRARVVRDIPATAQFEFRILARPLEEGETVPAEVVIQDSDNGISLSVNRDANEVPFVMGFIGLSPMITEPTSTRVDMAILTFYNLDRTVVWSEIMPINGTLTNHDSLLIWSKFEQASIAQVPEVASVEAKFILNRGITR